MQLNFSFGDLVELKLSKHVDSECGIYVEKTLYGFVPHHAVMIDGYIYNIPVHQVCVTVIASLKL